MIIFEGLGVGAAAEFSLFAVSSPEADWSGEEPTSTGGVGVGGAGVGVGGVGGGVGAGGETTGRRGLFPPHPPVL